LTKRTVFSIILEYNPDQDLHNKNAHILRTPIFQRPKQKKKCANYASKYGISFEYLFIYESKCYTKWRKSI